MTGKEQEFHRHTYAWSIRWPTKHFIQIKKKTKDVNIKRTHTHSLTSRRRYLRHNYGLRYKKCCTEVIYRLRCVWLKITSEMLWFLSHFPPVRFGWKKKTWKLIFSSKIHELEHTVKWWGPRERLTLSNSYSIYSNYIWITLSSHSNLLNVTRNDNEVDIYSIHDVHMRWSRNRTMEEKQKMNRMFCGRIE